MEEGEAAAAAEASPSPEAEEAPPASAEEALPAAAKAEEAAPAAEEAEVPEPMDEEEEEADDALLVALGCQAAKAEAGKEDGDQKEEAKEEAMATEDAAEEKDTAMDVEGDKVDGEEDKDKDWKDEGDKSWKEDGEKEEKWEGKSWEDDGSKKWDESWKDKSWGDEGDKKWDDSWKEKEASDEKEEKDKEKEESKEKEDGKEGEGKGDAEGGEAGEGEKKQDEEEKKEEEEEAKDEDADEEEEWKGTKKLEIDWEDAAWLLESDGKRVKALEALAGADMKVREAGSLRLRPRPDGVPEGAHDNWAEHVAKVFCAFRSGGDVEVYPLPDAVSSSSVPFTVVDVPAAVSTKLVKGKDGKRLLEEGEEAGGVVAAFAKEGWPPEGAEKKEEEDQAEQVPLEQGAKVQAKYGNGWFDAEVLELLEGKVKVRWGFDNSEEEVARENVKAAPKEEEKKEAEEEAPKEPPPLEVGMKVEGKYGASWFECTLLEVGEKILKVKWGFDDSEEELVRSNVRAPEGQAKEKEETKEAEEPPNKVYIYGGERGRLIMEMRIASICELKAAGCLASRTWRADECEGVGWSHAALTLNHNSRGVLIGKSGVVRKRIAKICGSSLEYIGDFVHVVGTGQERRRTLAVVEMLQSRDGFQIKAIPDAMDEAICTRLGMHKDAASSLNSQRREQVRHAEEETGTMILYQAATSSSSGPATKAAGSETKLSLQEGAVVEGKCKGAWREATVLKVTNWGADDDDEDDETDGRTVTLKWAHDGKEATVPITVVREKLEGEAAEERLRQEELDNTATFVILGDERSRRFAQLRIMDLAEACKPGTFPPEKLQKDFSARLRELTEEEAQRCTQDEVLARMAVAATAAGCIMGPVGRNLCMLGSEEACTLAKEYVGPVLVASPSATEVDAMSKSSYSAVLVPKEKNKNLTPEVIAPVERDLEVFVYSDDGAIDAGIEDSVRIIVCGRDEAKREAAIEKLKELQEQEPEGGNDQSWDDKKDWEEKKDWDEKKDWEEKKDWGEKKDWDEKKDWGEKKDWEEKKDSGKWGDEKSSWDKKSSWEEDRKDSKGWGEKSDWQSNKKWDDKADRDDGKSWKDAKASSWGAEKEWDKKSSWDEGKDWWKKDEEKDWKGGGGKSQEKDWGSKDWEQSGSWDSKKRGRSDDDWQSNKKGRDGGQDWDDKKWDKGSSWGEKDSRSWDQGKSSGGQSWDSGRSGGNDWDSQKRSWDEAAGGGRDNRREPFSAWGSRDASRPSAADDYAKRRRQDDQATAGSGGMWISAEEYVRRHSTEASSAPADRRPALGRSQAIGAAAAMGSRGGSSSGSAEAPDRRAPPWKGTFVKQAVVGAVDAANRSSAAPAQQRAGPPRAFAGTSSRPVFGERRDQPAIGGRQGAYVQQDEPDYADEDEESPRDSRKPPPRRQPPQQAPPARRAPPRKKVDPKAVLDKIGFPETTEDWESVQDEVFQGHEPLPKGWIRIWSRSQDCEYFLQLDTQTATFELDEVYETD